MISRFLMSLIVILLISGCGSEKAPAVGDKQAQVVVYLGGFVAKPGTYRIQSGTSLGEVIKTAGGFTSEADVSNVELSKVIDSTIQIYIPNKNGTRPSQISPESAEPLHPPGAVPAKDDGRLQANSLPVKVIRGIPSSSLTSEEAQMLELINNERASNGFKPFNADARLIKAARLKSQDMIDNNYFAHESPRYGVPSAMIAAQGVSYHYFGENIAISSSVEQGHKNLMGSPGHRQNLLNPVFNQIGIGIIQGPRGLVISQEFTD